jgi:hypothetical protein
MKGLGLELFLSDIRTVRGSRYKAVLRVSASGSGGVGKLGWSTRWTRYSLAQIWSRKFTELQYGNNEHITTRLRIIHTITMSTAKRPAHNVFGSSQLVKRSKPDANAGSNSAVAVVNGSGQNGALIQAVCRDTGDPRDQDC